MDGVRAVPWWTFFRETGNRGIVTNSIRGAFTMGQHVLFPTFRVVATSVISGTVKVSLRFGFRDVDAEVATQGIDFNVLSVPFTSDTRSPVWINGAVAPNFNGNPNSILPPRVEIFLTTDAGVGFNGLYEVSYAGLQVN